MTSSHPLVASLPDVIHLPADAERGQALEISIRQIIDETADPRATSASIVVALIDVLLLRILQAWHGKLPAEQVAGWAAAVADPAIAPALRAIHGSPAVPWTVETLARQSGLSRAAFARRFNSVLGEPPLAYLTGWRMTMARRLLRETELPLSAIAERTGYGSEFAFAKAFKRESGRAPGSYRLASAARPGRLPAPPPGKPPAQSEPVVSGVTVQLEGGQSADETIVLEGAETDGTLNRRLRGHGPADRHLRFSCARKATSSQGSCKATVWRAPDTVRRSSPPAEQSDDPEAGRREQGQPHVPGQGFQHPASLREQSEH